MSETVRQLVRQAVTDRVPIDGGEAERIAEFIVNYDRLADPFDQAADPIHVTGSAIVVGPRGVVLLKHKRLGLWLQPGGHIDPGETPWEAALREAEEETGLAVSFADQGDVPPLVHVDVHPGGRGHTHLDLRYLVFADASDPDPPAGESQEVGWYDWADAADRASDDRLAALLRHLAVRRPGAVRPSGRFPLDS